MLLTMTQCTRELSCPKCSWSQGGETLRVLQQETQTGLVFSLHCAILGKILNLNVTQCLHL